MPGIANFTFLGLACDLRKYTNVGALDDPLNGVVCRTRSSRYETVYFFSGENLHLFPAGKFMQICDISSLQNRNYSFFLSILHAKAKYFRLFEPHFLLLFHLQSMDFQGFDPDRLRISL